MALNWQRTLSLVLGLALLALTQSGFEPAYLPPCRHKGERSWTDGRMLCKCPPELTGPLCQLTRVNFEQAADYVSTRAPEPLVISPSPDNQFHLRFSFVCNDFNSTGSILSLKSADQAELQLEVGLQNGLPHFQFEFRKTPAKLNFEGSRSFTDNQWHMIDLFIRNDPTEFQISVILDQCSYALCFKTLKIPHQTTGNPQEYRVGQLLRVGKHGSQPEVFLKKLCVDEIYVQGNLIDFWESTEKVTQRRGCKHCEQSCQGKCGPNSICRNSWSNSNMYTCRCLSGSWAPDDGPGRAKCSPSTAIQVDTTEPYRWSARRTEVPVNIGLSFRTESTSFDILTIGNAVRVWLSANVLNLEFGSETLSLETNTDFSDGNWHHLHVGISAVKDKSSFYVELMLDGLDGARRAVRILPFDKKTAIQQEYGLAYKAKQTCIDDFWINWPANIEYSDQEYPLYGVAQSAHFSTQCESTSSAAEHKCSPTACPNNMVCEPMWRNFRCACKPPMKESDQGPNGTKNCVEPQCAPNPCLNGGICEPESDLPAAKFKCRCKDSWAGITCNEATSDMAEAAFSWWIILVILLILLLLLLVLAIFCLWCPWLRRRKREEKLISEALGRESTQKSYDDHLAGEVDYKGHIDLALLDIKPSTINHAGNYYVDSIPSHTPARTFIPNSNGTDGGSLISWQTIPNRLPAPIPNIDGTLAYGFEGFDEGHVNYASNLDWESSSIGSKTRQRY